MKKAAPLGLSVLLLAAAYAQQIGFPVLKGPFLGQKPPGMIPELFAPGIVSAERDLHSCPVFSKDGNLIFWRTMNSPAGNGIYFMERKNDRWTAPVLAPFLHPDDDVPYFPYDDHTLFFISKKENQKSGKHRIWFSKRIDGKWEKPECFAEFDPPIDLIHWQFTFSKRGNIYFGGIQEGGYGAYDLFEAVKTGAAGPYSYKILPPPWNSKDSETCPYIAPDENFLIFASEKRKDGFGELDLYIRFKKADGTWTDPVNMGPTINTSSDENCPMISPDGQYIFFLSFKSGKCHPYWVSAKIIDKLRPKESA